MMVGFHQAASFITQQKGNELRGFIRVQCARRNRDSVTYAFSAKLWSERGEALKIKIHLNLFVKFFVLLLAQIDFSGQA